MKRLFIFLAFIALCSIQNSNAQTILRGVVVEEGTKKPIAGAKLGVSNQGPGVLSADNGRFLYRKYHHAVTSSSDLHISAEGYEAVHISGEDLRNLFNLNSTIVLKPATGGTTDSKVAVKDVTIFWDASLSSNNQNKIKQLDFLNAYIGQLGDIAIRFVAFSDKIILDKKIEIAGGDISALRGIIEGLTYEGATDYNLVSKSKADAVLLFSDGQQSFGELQLDRNTPVYFVNTVTTADHETMISDAAYYSGSYIPLFSTSAQEAQDRIVQNKPFTLTEMSSAQNNVKGIVRSASGPIQGAAVSIRGTLEEFSTKSDGTFTVPASEGDVLQIRALGMYPKDILVANDPIVNVEMIAQADLLDAVTVNGKKKVEQEKIEGDFAQGKTKEKVGFAVNTLTADQIKPNATFLGDAIRGNFAGVQVLGPPGGEKFLIRGGNMSINNELPPLWVVDGAPQSDVPYYIDPQNIKSITILKSSIAAVRYGTIATGGAFLVKTKTGNPDETAQGPKVDRALVKGNDYIETLAGFTESASPYITILDKEKTVAAKYAKYIQQSENFKNSVSFYADNAEYFQKLDPVKAEAVRSKLAELAINNVKALRILSYLYESAGAYKRNAQINERIVALAPREAQSYRDLAHAYSLSGDQNKALEIYINILGERILGVDFTDIEGPIGNELRNLVALHKDKIEFNRLPNEWLTNDLDLDIRLVIEWSEQDAPFVFQFVNPKKKFFTWNHTLFENKERLLKERKAGYQFEEFVIDDAKSGEWLVNIQYLGQEATFTIPPYLKYTMYRNYGTNKQTKEIKIIKLFDQQDKVSLGKIML